MIRCRGPATHALFPWDIYPEGLLFSFRMMGDTSETGFWGGSEQALFQRLYGLVLDFHLLGRFCLVSLSARAKEV